MYIHIHIYVCRGGHTDIIKPSCGHVALSISRGYRQRGFSAQWDHIEFFFAGHISPFRKLFPRASLTQTQEVRLEEQPFSFTLLEPKLSFYYTL